MKNIFKALASKDQPNELQFEAFSQYVNSVILKRLGYLPDSRLGLYLQNTRRLLDKLTDYKGMTCGIELGL